MCEKNMIQECLRKYLGAEDYAKFLQVLEFLTDAVYIPIYKSYNDHLVNDFQKISYYSSSFPDGYTIDVHLGLKIKFYSFRFITNLGKYLIELHDRGNEKAEKYFIIIIKILLHHSFISKSDTANLALVELEQLCILNKTTLPELYQKYRDKFLRLIIKAILEKLMMNGRNGSNDASGNGNGSGQTNGANCVIMYMNRAFELFNIVTINVDDIAQSLIITTNLIHKDKFNDAIKLFLENLAKYQSIDVSTLIRTHIQAIMVSLLLKRKLSHFDITASLKKLCKFCDKTPNEILATKYTHIKGRLLLEYSTSPKMVTDAIYYLSKFEKDESEQPFEDEFEDVSAFMDYINPSLIGILLGVDSHFISNAKVFGNDESLKHIESITTLVSMLSEQQVQTIHHKLLSTLSLLLRLRPKRDNMALNTALKDLWAAFLKKLTKDLRESLVINISVALYDLVEDCPEIVAELYSDLLCGSRSRETKTSLKSLFFIPNAPGFEEVYKQLTPYVCRSKTVSSLEELQYCLDCALPLMKFENQKCHLLALTRIKELLKFNQHLLMSKMLVNLDEPLDQTISKTIESLLALSSTQDSDCSILIAECLGIIGAVNPIRLNHLIYGELSDKAVCVTSLSDPNFVVALIERLKNSLFSDRRNESENANYALQVVVKTYQVTTEPPIIKKLSEEALRACQLCKNTSYMGARRNPPDLGVPVFIKFKNENQYSYKEWLDKFSLVLISFLEDPKIQQVVYACAYIFKYNLKLAEFILPVVVIHIILNQPSKLGIIYREVMAIITEDIGVSTQDLDTVYTQDIRNSLQTLHFQCSNMVFCLLDALIKLERNVGRQIVLERSQVKRLKEFNSSIPKEKLAILASKCRAYTRALCYFDQYFLANKKWPHPPKRDTDEGSTDTNKYWTPLQKVYIALDDPFDAAGVDKVRISPTSMNDELANYESSGSFDEALTCYTALLEIMDKYPDKEPTLEDALRCLSNQGDYQRLYDMSKRLITDYPQLKRSILPAAIEASWKLSKWDELNCTFKNEQCDALLEQAPVSHGYLLSSLCESRKDTFEKLKIVRNKLMRPLSISMMDRNAYFRGYQNLLVLHSIEDFALALEVLEGNQFETQQLDENTIDIMRLELSKKLDSLYDVWNKRNKLVQPSHRSIEPLLAWQRSISLALSRKYPFLQPKIDVDVGLMWLVSANSARKARSFNRSFYCLSRARRWFGFDFHNLGLDLCVKYTLGHAKLNWEKGEQTKAIHGLKLALERLHNHGLYKHLKTRKQDAENAKISKNPPPYDPFPDLSATTPCTECSKFSLSDRNSFAQLMILLTRYSEEAAASMPEAMLFMYQECVHLGVNQEEIFLCLARYYDKLASYYTENPKILTYLQADKLSEKQSRLSNVEGTPRLSQSALNADMEDVCTRLMEQSILAFGNSMKYGVRYLEESMPRMLNIWFDLGMKVQKNRVATRDVSSRTENTVRFIDSLLKPNVGVPSYYFLTAISLLLSRVNHTHSGVSDKTNKILEQLLVDYPHQMMWRLLALINEEEKRDRRMVANKIIKQAMNRNTKIETVVRDTLKFSDILMKLCLNYSSYAKGEGHAKLPPGPIEVRQIEPSVRNLQLANIQVIAPIQASMQAILPTVDDCNNLKEYNIFPQHRVAFIRSIENKARIYNSLQAPRQITFKCNNGEFVHILCKPGDDLRKDSRCIEFFNLLNRVLRKGSQSSARFFEITTFLVLPLKHNAGIIEMVPNLETLRTIVERLYKDTRGDRFNMHEGPNRRQKESEVLATEMYRQYTTQALPRVTPPVLQAFFLQKFPDPTSWYMARLAYVRSTAVISMGGYIIGLGDRHLDNILIDVCHGRVVHVDFNLLFHQAETLPCPETVPFRLTQNIVSAFGPVGVEGNFRKFCEIAMQAMRDEKEALLTTLKPFIHDPCSEWTKSTELTKKDKEKKQNSKDSKETRQPEQVENEIAKSRIEVVERKLKGFPRSRKFKPLAMLNSYSVEAQVDNLIEEASNLFNLAQMYFGWAPHI